MNIIWSRRLVDDVERAEAVEGYVGVAPVIVTGQTDVVPTQRRNMLQEIVGNSGARASQMIRGAPKIHCVPVNDRCRDEIKAGSSIALVFERPIGETALFMYENGLIERMARLALVQPGMTSPP